MKRSFTILAACAAVLALAFSTTGCKKLKARDSLNRGVAAFKNAKYGEAVEHFQTAIDLDPTYPTARLYLATAYMSQYIPGAESEENIGFAKSAMEHFQKALDMNPKDATAVESIASLHFQQSQGIQNFEDKVKKLDEAAEWYRKLTEVDPNKKEAYYSLGVIAWGKWYNPLMTARAKLGMKPDDTYPIKDKKVRDELREKYGALIEEGIKNLNKALEIDKEYDDAMAYMNLLIRERADLAESIDEYNKDIETANMWVQKTLETKKIKAERAPKTTGIINEDLK